MSVVFIMTDGMRPDAMTICRTPNLDQFMARGSFTLNARSVMPSITLPCHTSIFHSVTPERHGILENIWHPMARPVPGLVEQLHLHEKRCGFIHNWEPLRDLNRPENLYFSFYINTSYNLDGDEIITETAIQHLQSHSLDFAFVYYGTIDTSGHAFGWMSDEYFRQIEKVDGLIGQLLNIIPGETTVIIHSDHGGHDRTHGTESPEDLTIPWMIAGPNIKQNHTIEQAVTLLDTAPTVAHVLGVPLHKQWEGNIVQEIFV